MTGTSTATPTRTIAIISRHYLVCLGLQNILEGSKTGHVVHLHQRMTPDLLLTEKHPDVFVLDLETDQDAIGTIRQIRESAPNSKIVLLSGVKDKERLHEVFALGVDGVVLHIQPPGVMLATIEALYASVPHRAQVEPDGVVWVDVPNTSKWKVDSATQRPAWAEDLTEREREVIRLVRQGLSNKEIAYRLSIADSTVRHHLTNIFDKVGVPNRQKLLIHTHHVQSTPG